ncbi:MAG: hypothetical protein HY683_06870 [Chloroflexi bacterium]|nr:hypothetical protein [Chloroflexota bacterium]
MSGQELARDYLLLVFLTSCGVLQVAAAHSRLRGLFLLRSAWSSGVLGASLIVVAFVWFFVPDPRAVSDTAGGLNGNRQAAYFSIGASAALLVTLLLSSLVNWTLGPPEPSARGLDALRTTTFLRALPVGLRDLWRRVQQWTQHSFFGSTAG